MNWISLTGKIKSSVAIAIVVLPVIVANAQSIATISPPSGPIGTPITITGSGFNASGPNDVYFGPVKVTTNANAAGTLIVVNVPAGATSVTPIVVRNNATGLQASSLGSLTPYFTVTHAPALAITSSSYTRSSFGGSASFTIATGDLDNDGFADIISGVQGSANIQMRKNNGLGSFPTTFPSLALSNGATAFGFGVGDLDGDGNLDIVASKTDALDIDLYQGNGDGTFNSFPSITGVTGGGAGITIGDINNDGNLDILTSSFSDLFILLGDGTGSFSHGPSSPFTLAGANTSDMSLSDINKDGFLDLAIGSNNSVLVLLNNQDATFANPLTYAAGTNAFGVVSGDYDNDSNVDLAVLSYGSSNVTVLQGDGSGGFAPFAGSPIAIGGTPLGIDQGDFDGDGILDLLVGGGDQENVQLLKGDGTGSFSSFPGFPTSLGTNNQPYGILTTDFNNDGVADIAYANSVAATFDVLLSPPSFRTTWVTTDSQLTIPTTGGGYNYNIVWTNLSNPGVGNGAAAGITGNYTIFGLTNGDTYQVNISGDFAQIFLNGVFTNADKLRSIEQWGGIEWLSMENSFNGARNMIINAQDSPDLSQVTSLSRMFQSVRDVNAFTNTDLSLWDVSTITDMSYMFYFAWYFNQDISNWDVSKVTTFFYTFAGTVTFNQPLEAWVFPDATDMTSMFDGTQAFNQPLQNWDVSNITNMSYMFFEAGAFNQPLEGWDVGAVTDMSYMFYDATVFNQQLNGWDVSAVDNMEGMFYLNPAFNQPINNWVVSNVTNMYGMFDYAAVFNQPLDNWDVSQVTDMDYMFEEATAFNQNLGNWDIGSVTTMLGMLDNTNLSVSNYDATLIGWADDNGGTQTIPSGITLGAAGLNYCSAVAARNALTSTFGWSITDAGEFCPFVTTWRATGGTISIPTNLTDYTTGYNNFKVYYTNMTNPGIAEGSIVSIAPTITGLEDNSIYRVEIIGDFPAIYFNGTTSGNQNKILSIEQWGDIQWQSMKKAFSPCPNLVGNATDAPDLTQVSDMTQMFLRTSFNQDISNWDVSNVTTMYEMFYQNTAFNNGGAPLNWGAKAASIQDMTGMFEDATSFNQDISNWDVNGALSMFRMFAGATSFNNGGVPLSWTDLNNVNIVQFMFGGATAFNQDISSWNFNNLTSLYGLFSGATAYNNGGVPLNWGNKTAGIQNMYALFQNATAFNQDISGWDVSNVSNMGSVFRGTSSFNQDLSSWNVSGANDMSFLFSGATSFNNAGAPLAWGIKVGSVQTMRDMFANAISFNQDISDWDVSNVADMSFMFTGASAFDQIIGSWDIGSVSNMANMLDNSNLSVGNYEATLDGWADNNGGLETVPSGITLGALGLQYTSIATGRQTLVSTNGWTIVGDILLAPMLVLRDPSNNVISSGSTLPFEVLARGDNAVQTIRVVNDGTQGLNGLSLNVTGQVFTSTLSTSSLNPGESTTMTFTFTPTETGVFSETATFSSPDLTSDVVLQLNGEARFGSKIIVYNVVTPNGDGKHDFLKIEGITEYPGNRVSIFDRWGRVVYEANDYDNNENKFEGFDANGDGRALPNGTYYYVIETGKEKTSGYLQISTTK